MVRRLALLLVVLGALAVVPAASAAFPGPYAVQGDQGIPGLTGSFRFYATDAGSAGTRLTKVRSRDSALVRETTIRGEYGIAQLTQSGLTGGLFHDGTKLVLQSMGLHDTSSFAIVRASDLGLVRTITLQGTFGFDALSPDGSTLYLIQHTTKQDVEHYVVRAYDLGSHTLLPGRVADKTQASWLMQGWAVSRAATGDGRWAYTLYANPGGYPFVHALDTVAGVAHCIGLPWLDANQNPVWNFTLAVQGGSLLVRRADGRVWKRVDRSTWALS